MSVKYTYTINNIRLTYQLISGTKSDHRYIIIFDI